ncbi:MAG TPA: hypothetical protein VFP59_13975 [Candidatus Angelobacter sp.]|nr:hypothetical protein [Candidatus Angelobacter sp.]
MDLKTWFKGLAVFVASSLITSVAASSLDPSAFNFSRAGLARLASLAALIGAKAVYLYMKQSPLPGTNPAADLTKVTRVLALALLLPMMIGTSGCYNSWERSTYATLAAGKAVIDCAVAGYNHFDPDIRQACSANPGDPAFDPAQFYLPQTRAAQQAIEKARQVQTACVEAFAGYAVAKVAKDKSASIAEKQALVVSYLAQLPALLDAVRNLLPDSANTGSKPASGSESLGTAPPMSRLFAPDGVMRLAPQSRSARASVLGALAAERKPLQSATSDLKFASSREVQLGR